MTKYTPKHLKRWTRPECYFGASWPEYYSAGVGRHRDSDTLERSNFAVMLDELGGESETVRVVRERHWAVGWIEWIAIHEDDSKALAIADNLAADLEVYPVLDEDHLSKMETEEADRVWKECFSPRERIQYIRENRNQFYFHDFRDMLAVVRGEYFNGYASELLR